MTGTWGQRIKRHTRRIALVWDHPMFLSIIGRKYTSETKGNTTLIFVHRVGKVYLHAGIAAHKNIIPEKQYYPLAISTKSHRRLTMRPERPVLHMCRNFLHGHGIWYGVSSVFIDTSQNKFRLLWGQEIILIREGRNKKPCDHSRHQGDEAFNDLNVI